MCGVNLRALDKAYSVAFPKSTPININKKGKEASPPASLQRARGVDTIEN
jgi:hypothetical protein